MIVAFGDSLTSGSGASTGRTYPDVLADLTHRTVINAGVPGEVSEAGRQRLAGVLVEHSPRLLILIHGGNDLLRGLDDERLRANLAAMLRTARSRNVAVVMLGVPERGLFLNSADLYQELADEFSVPIDTDTLPAILSDRSLKSDTIHPNDKGYRMIAESVYRLLADHGAL
ncbi:MAG: GDSL-type esterase/lipase family protein [Gammaproteobacteria bacterium]